MGFKVSARTILQLGAELISSDSVAFYELIKNAFDAKSKRVDISIVVRLPYQAYLELRQLLASYDPSSKDPKAPTVQSIQAVFLHNLDPAAVEIDKYKARVTEAKSSSDLTSLLHTANYIEIEDKGHGMSLADLRNVYLTIGTRSRLEEREELQEIFDRNGEQITPETKRPVLGEKGVGRLSTMRLGDYLEVRTSRSGEKRWNLLSIDWTLFSHHSDQLLEDIKISPRYGEEKEDSDDQGTTVQVFGLKSEWTRSKLEEIAKSEFSKLTDPFTPAARYPIKLSYNKEPVKITPFNKQILNWAHAVVEGNFSKTGLRLAGKMDFRLHGREKYFQLEGTHLHSVTGASEAILRSLGSFSFKFYWYNRQLLTAIDGIGNQKQVRELVAQWAGGLMLYRDGFRVFPYGNPGDDWLGLDRKALASGGYKLNRQQFIGKVDITSLENLQLNDQTNREGLTDNDEKRVLIKLLYYAIRTEFKNFMDSVNKELKGRGPVDLDTLDERIGEHRNEIIRNLNLLVKEYPQIKAEVLIARIRASADEMQAVMSEVQEMAKTIQGERSQTIHLAGLGLMVEVLAHELNRATAHTLITLAGANHSDQTHSAVFRTLESQLKTLQQRLRILDPLSTSGRQRKETFDLFVLISDSLSSHEAQFARDRIKCRLTVEPAQTNPTYRVVAVKGMILQVIENLISNSVYWLKQQMKLEPAFQPLITVTIDTRRKQLRFSDNGPGIPPARREDIFQPFFTTKPPGEGKGLGLYISREIAEYHGGELYLSETHAKGRDSLNTFVFALEANGK